MLKTQGVRSIAPRMVAAALCLLGAWACSSPPTARQREKELAEEISLGRGIAASLLGKFKLDETKPNQSRYVATVGSFLAKKIGRPELTFHFALVREGPANAYAAPGGYIFLSRALINRMKTEDELVTVLAHEIAHVNLSHVYQKVRKPKDVSFGATLSRLMSQGGGDLSFALGEAVKAGMKLLVEDGLGPQLEAEADEAALAYALSLGFDAGALPRILARTADSVQGLPKSHPPLQARLERLDRTLLAQTGRNSKFVSEPKSRVQRFKQRMAL